MVASRSSSLPFASSADVRNAFWLDSSCSFKERRKSRSSRALDKDAMLSVLQSERVGRKRYNGGIPVNYCAYKGILPPNDQQYAGTTMLMPGRHLPYFKPCAPWFQMRIEHGIGFSCDFAIQPCNVTSLKKKKVCPF